jgi:hypothetical protein
MKRLLARWRDRRRELAMKQLEAEVVRDVHPELDARGTAFGAGPDAVASRHAMEQHALGSVLNPKARTTTEWRGD